jgi:WD40 repeat protein/serine/threonine protein kinase
MVDWEKTQEGNASCENLASGVAPEAWRPSVGSQHEPSTPALDFGQGPGEGTPGRFGAYELVAQIAHGGMGVVYEAYHPSLDRTVALKMILSGRLAGPGAVERFRIEAQAAARLEHPNIVPIYEVGECQGVPYYSMRLVEGGNLRQALSDGPLPFVRAAELMVLAARAMEYAHQRGVLHRDLKPANVLLDALGQPHITDFGLAKLSERAAELTRSATVIGTPNYMAPEQACGRSREVTAAADIYSLGAILYEMLTARPPFQGESEMDVLRQVVADLPLRPHLLRPKLDRSLETICLKCLEKEPHLRYATCEELARDLERWLRHEPIHARPSPVWERVAKWARRRPLQATLAGVISLSVIVAGLLWSDAARQRAHVATASSQNELKNIEDLFARHESTAALARLARLAREERANPVVATRLIAALSQRAFTLPAGDLVHRDEILTASYSPDSRWVVTGSRDRTARIWDAHTAHLWRELAGHQAEVRWVRFSPDSQRVATGSADGTARIWEVETGRSLMEFPSHEPAVRYLEFSPRGNWLLTVSTNVVRIWDADSGEAIRRIVAAEGTVHEARFSPDAEHIVTASHDGVVQVWHSRTGQPAGQPLRHGAPVRVVRFSPDGQRVVTASDDETARLWTLRSGEVFVLRHAGVVSWAEFSTGGDRVVTACHDGSVTLWDVATGSQLPGGFKHLKQVNSAVFSPDGLVLLSASDDGTVQLSEGYTGQALAEPVPCGGFVEAGLFSPDGSQFVTWSSESLARLWRMPGPPPLIRPLPRSENVSWVAFSADGRLAAIVSGQAVRLWNAQTGRPLGEPQILQASIQMAQFDTSGKKLLMTAGSVVQVFPVAALDSPELTLRNDNPVQAADFSADHQWIVLVSGRTARIWATQTGTPTPWQFVHDDLIESAHFSPDSRQLATASRDRTARIWELRGGRVRSLPHQSSVLAARFSNDGRQLATGTTDGIAQVWDIQTARPLGQPLHHRGEVNSVAFSPDNQRLVSATSDQTLHVWDIHTSQELTEPLRTGERVWGARFTSCGRWVVTESGLIWEAPSFSSPTPAWSSELAEAIAGSHFDHGNLSPVPAENLSAVANRLEQAAQSGDYYRWGRWLLADWRTRTISPSAVITVPEYVERQLTANTLESLREAARLCPTNAQVRLHLNQLMAEGNHVAAQK